MSEARTKMVRALKAVVVPVLREHGFTGSFPHLRRLRGHLELVTFQFDRNGGGFVIELGRCGANGVTTAWGEQIHRDQVRAWDAAERTRVEAREGSGTDSWFRFGDARSPSDFTSVAQAVLPFLPVIEEIFRDFDRTPKLGEKRAPAADSTPARAEPHLDQESFDF